MNAATLTAENETLRGLVVSFQQQLTSTQEQLTQVQRENQLLRQKLEAFIRRYFGGGKSEAIDPKQLELLLAGLGAPMTPATEAQKTAAQPSREASSRRTPAGRQPLPEHLPVERVVLEPEPVRAQPEAFKKIGEEVTEELDWKPATFFKRHYVRPKYVRRTQTPGPADEPAVLIAPLPSRLIEKGLPGAGLQSA